MVDAIILDGSAIVQMLNPRTSKTFQEYADTVFAPYISAQLEKTDRIDIVQDVYIPDSLEGTTRQKRGKGTRKRVAPSTAMLRNWTDILYKVDDSKAELFDFLSREVTHIPYQTTRKYMRRAWK